VSVPNAQNECGNTVTSAAEGKLFNCLYQRRIILEVSYLNDKTVFSGYLIKGVLVMFSNPFEKLRGIHLYKMTLTL
jgi:hypothetical protein